MTTPAPVTDPTAAPIAGLDADATARQAAYSGGVHAYDLELRQGIVVDVDRQAGTVDLTLGGDPTIIEGVRHISNYRPLLGDLVYVFLLGPDLFAIDKLNNTGPSIQADFVVKATASTVALQGYPTDTFFQSTPQIDVEVSGSGRLLVGISSLMHSDNTDGGGAFGVWLDGASASTEGISIEPNYQNALINYMGLTAALWHSMIEASRVLVYSGLTPGKYRLSASYAGMDKSTTVTNATFRAIEMWAWPL